MAEVFKAKSYGVEGFEKIVVIKRILPDLARSKEFVDLFIHEAKLAVRLSHANVVQVFDLGLAPGGELFGKQQPDAYYMAMEFVQGLDLASLLTRARREQLVLPPEMCAYIIAEVAKGLDHAHRRRDEQMRPLHIVHRDVSPQNVLLSLEGEVKVTDFGIAKARGALDQPDNVEDTQARKLQGKFNYMSPEQARGESVDASSDIFSLGAVLYECLTGLSPYSAPTTFETLRRAQNCDYPPLDQVRKDCPKELLEIQRTAMAQNARERFADAGRLHEALLAFQYGHGHRFGASDLATFLERFRPREEREEPIASVFPLAGEARTPVDVAPAGAQTGALSVATGTLPHENAENSEETERREVSALVVALPRRSDGEGLDPREADHLASTIARYGGVAVATDREVSVALFGVRDPDGRDTEVATRCGLVLLRELGDIGVGIHVGRVGLHADGSVSEDDLYKALLARARALAETSTRRCTLSPSAARHVRTMFDLGQLAHPVERGWIVRDVRPLAETFGRFIGRKDQLRQAGEVLAHAAKRRAQVLTIRGDNGIGKTRFLVEVERRLRKGNYNVGFYLAVCPPQGRSIPHSGIVCMLHAILGLHDGETPRAEVLEPRLRALGLPEDECASVLSALGAVDIDHQTGTFGANDLRPGLRAAFAHILTSLCEDRPHLFSWDAAHGMDAESLAMLEAIFERIATTRLVLTFAARAGFTHPLERVSSHSSIELGDLSEDEADRLVATRLGVDQATPDVLRFIRERAGGHPLFIEEVVKGLVSARAVTVAERRIVSVRLVGQDLALPKTLRGLVSSRVAQLEDNVRRVLYAASVIGDPVPLEILGALSKASLTDLERLVAVLIEKDFLIHTGPTELRFRSPIVREVVMDALPSAISRELHGAAGEALEQDEAHGSIEHAGRVARHFYEAGDRERAATYFAKSGERRLDSRQLEAATQDLARAISLCEPATRPPAELARWLAGLASAVRLTRAAPDAIELCERVIARADAAGNSTLRVAVRVHAGRVLGAVHLIDLARAQFVAAEHIAGTDDSLLRQVLSAGAELASRQGDFRRSLAIHERLEKLAGSGGSKQDEHKTLIGLAEARAAAGDRDGALTCLARAEGLLPADAPSACERQRTRVLIEYFSADLRAAGTACELATDVARQLGLGYEVAENLQTLGEIFIRLDDFPRAYGALKQALVLAEEGGHDRLGVRCRTALAFLDAVAADRDADKVLKEGIAYAESNDFTWDRLTGLWLLALLYVRRGALDAARNEYERLLQLATEAGNELMANDARAALRRERV
jgi:tetratricopeptide (TPR) repeat protein